MILENILVSIGGDKVENNNIMLNLILELILKLVIVLLVILILRKMNKKDIPNFSHSIWLFLFSIISLIIFDITGAGSILDAAPLSKSMFAAGQINLIPLFGNDSGHLFEKVLNLLLFVPLGFVLPIAWKTFAKAEKTVLFGASLSLYIEVTQLLNIRMTDIDDLIFNTLGTLVGYLILKSVRAIFKKQPALQGEDKSYQHAERIEIITLSVILILIQQLIVFQCFNL